MDEKRKNISKKKIAVIVIIILLVATAAFRIITDRLKSDEPTASDVINIKVATAELSTLENTSPLTARLEPVEEVSLVPKVAGEVTGVYVELGDKVSKGTVLFELDKTQMATSYNQASISLNDASVNLNRMSILYNAGAVSLQQYEQAQTQYSLAQESLKAAGEAMSNCTVTSPISGYVTSINVAAGTIASQATPAVSVANIDKLEIDVNVSESMINKINTGDKVQVLVQSVSEKPFSGTVTALSPAPAAGSLTYPLKVTLDNAGPSVKPGMFAEVIITTDKKEDVITVPSNAVLIKSGKTVVAVIDGKNKVMFQKVEVGVDNGDVAEIKSGIKAGDTIVVEGQYYLEETSKVNIIE